jgi:hypothetical protein
MMLDFLDEDLKRQFDNQRWVDWRLKVFLLTLSMAFAYKFGRRMMITSLCRDYNPKSAHYSGDKLTCAADVRSKDLDIEHLAWFANLNDALNPYVEMIIEDDRLGREGLGGPHIHIEINPDYWISLRGMI